LEFFSSEFQHKKPQSKLEFEFSKFQLLNQHFLPLGLAMLHERAHKKVGPSQSPKKPCVEQQWYENLQGDTRGLVILL